MADQNTNVKLAEFASLFLSTDPGNWDSPENISRASALLPTTLPDNHVLCFVSSFSLDRRKHHSGAQSKESLALEVATSLDDELRFVASNIQSLGPTITRNILQSFMALVDSRVRSTAQAFYKHAQYDSSQRLMQILQALSTMGDSLVTPTQAQSRTRVVADRIISAGEEVCAPVLMETTIEVDILGEQRSVVLVAAGTIRAVFEPSHSSKIVYAKAAFDTATFLKILMANARDIVKFATKRLFEVFLLPDNTQVAQAMSSQVLHTDSQMRSGTGDDEKESDSPRMSPTVGDTGIPTSKLQNNFLSGKSFSGVDLLKMAAESLS